MVGFVSQQASRFAPGIVFGFSDLGPFHVACFGQSAIKDNVESAAVGFAEALRRGLFRGELRLGVVIELA